MAEWTRSEQDRLDALGEVDHWLYRLTEVPAPLTQEERDEMEEVFSRLRDQVFYPQPPKRVLPPIRYGSLR